MYEPRDIITTEAELRRGKRLPYAAQTGKILDHIDELCRVWIERSPFLMLATYSADGRVDVSPKGDPAGFVKVLDQHTLAIPDRPGNYRHDSVLNIFETGRIGLCFMVPNRNEVVRVNGSARVVRDTDLMETMAINGRVPDFAILVRVEEAFYHCGKSVIRSALWAPEKAAPVDGLPTYGMACKVHAALDEPLEEVEAHMQRNDTERLYDD